MNMKTQKWKTVPIDTSSIPPSELEFLGGIEELESYEILRPGTELKKSKKRKIKANKKDGKKNKKLKLKDTEVENEAPEDENNEEETEEIDMSAWNNCYFHGSILNGLKDLGFLRPTKIQELTIPAAVRGNQDILGAAETGSGKTLAFGIPILNGILAIKESKKQKNPANTSRPLYSLILTPTRELAIQIKKHLIAVAKHTDIKISSVVGGMAPEKQRRVLKKCPEIIVATPGRLWEMIEEGEEHLSDISKVRYLVIDEADRMVEKGHFAELTQILNLANGSDMNKRRQTFVFSATLTMIHDAPKRLTLKKKSKIQQKQKIESLVSLTGMKNPKVIDITNKSAVVESLTETQIMCNNEEKDSYLYYFLLMHPGRTLVFCNSIDCVRRLRSVLELLNCHPLPLHASMHQRQRLKNLDKFEQSKKCVLLATDVAARGLDIKGIEHVIHFQVPRTAETYVHRSGRTARAQNEGLSLMLIEPKDAIYYRNICNTLKKEKTLPTFPVDHTVFKLVKERVTLSRLIDKTEHRVKRLNAENRWFENAAKEMDVEIEEDNLLNDMGELHEQASKSREINLMKKQLKTMLSRPIVSKILTGCYPTKSGKLLSSSAFNPERAVELVKNIKNKKK